jgi:hypothetical protein
MASTRTAKKWGDTLEALVAERRNPRALVVETLGHMKRSVGWLSSHWAISQTTADVITDETGRRNHVWRKMRADELPENDPQEWDRLIEQAQALRLTAEELENYAHRQKAAALERRSGMHVVRG